MRDVRLLVNLICGWDWPGIEGKVQLDLAQAEEQTQLFAQLYPLRRPSGLAPPMAEELPLQDSWAPDINDVSEVLRNWRRQMLLLFTINKTELQSQRAVGQTTHHISSLLIGAVYAKSWWSAYGVVIVLHLTSPCAADSISYQCVSFW